MPLVKLKDKGQVTIPAAVREQIAAREGDLFEIAVENGAIVLRPQDVSERKTGSAMQKGVDISRWIGAGKGHFKTPDEVDEYIRAEREKWD